MDKKIIIGVIGLVIGVLIIICFIVIKGKRGGENTMDNIQSSENIEVTESRNPVTDVKDENNISNDTEQPLQDNEIRIRINDTNLIVKLENNSSAEALLEKLEQGDIVLNAHDYGNFEKVAELSFSLPKNDEYITTEPGDLILYQGNSITLYYDTNTWNFTRLGKVKNKTQEELRDILGDGDVTLILSIK